MINKKGQAAITGVVLLITAVIGLVIIDSVSQPTWDTTNTPNVTINPGRMYNNVSYAVGTLCRVGTDAVTVYDLTNGSLVADTDYEFPAGTTLFTLGTNASGDAHNNTLGTINYTGYDCGAYMDSDIARLVMENLALLAGVLVLSLGGMWLYIKGVSV